jgi:hypothetical protein
MAEMPKKGHVTAAQSQPEPEANEKGGTRSDTALLKF